MKVLVMGAAVIDIIIQLEQLPSSGQDVMAEHKETIVGGCAYNVSNILKQLKIEHDLFVPVGSGAYADVIRKQLQEDQYDIMLEDDSQDNGWNLSIVEQDGERTFITVPGIEVNWKREWFERIDIQEYDYIYVSGYELEGASGQVIIDALENKKESCQIIFDPSPRVRYIDQHTLTKVLGMGTILHLNRMELRELTGEQTTSGAVKKAYGMTNGPVIVTLGNEGTLYYTAEGSEVLSGKKVTVVDTIGAGDSHTGACIAGLAAQLPLREACLLGNEIAALVVQQQGGKLVL